MILSVRIRTFCAPLGTFCAPPTVNHSTFHWIFQVIMVVSWVDFSMARYGDYVYPDWANLLGWIISLSSSIVIMVYISYRIFKEKGPILQVSDVSVNAAIGDNFSIALLTTLFYYSFAHPSLVLPRPPVLVLCRPPCSSTLSPT